MMPTSESNRYIVQVYVGALSALYEALSVEASKQTTSEEIVSCIVERLLLNENATYELAEVIGDDFGQECKERSLSSSENPVQLMMLWPKNRTDQSSYRFYLREKVHDCVWRDQFVMDPQLIRDYFHRFLYQPKDREYPDLCQLPDLNEQTLLDNLRARFVAGHIYTYVGSILIALNPFKFYPIYNPKYVKLYQNRRLGPNLPPHIFAVANTAYHCMLKDGKNQCIVISGESGSGKTESTNFLLHHLTALSQKGSHGSGVEQTILSAGPVLEAFGNAKTAHNNNSSRFGKFIQVNYKENGMVHGAVVQKYLLEKSRICSQGRNERNYHVFYYLLEGVTEQEKQILHLKSPDQYYYLNKSCYSLENVDESYEFSRLKQSMEMVGFTAEKQRRLFSVLSAVLLLGNVEFQPRKSAYHHDESVGVKNPEVVSLISELLRVKQETLLQALTAKRARASGETLVINYRLPEAIASRDAMAKCLYGALFDWIVLQVNHALLSKKDTLREHQGNSIGVLDIFGFEDFGLNNSFEQLCINYANEHLQYYFNQHVFKYEQEEYRKEGIRWNNIDFMDNTGCLHLIEGKPNGLLCLLDDQCNFPGATNETLLQKFNTVHKDNKFYQKPQKKEGAFIVVHYAGKVKYQVTDMREKNLDLMRQDIVGVLKNSSMAFVRELVGADPVAVFRWAIVRAFFRAYFAFHEAGRKHRQGRVDGNKNNIQQRYQRNHIPNDNIISKQRNTLAFNRSGRNNENEVPTNNNTSNNNHSRLSWPQFYQRTRNVTCTKSPEDDRRRKESIGTSPNTALERVLCPDEARAIQRANQIVMKNKSFRPRERGKKGLKNLQSVKTLAGRTGLTATNQGQLGKARKQPLTVTAQFQQSLHSLMDTLNQANPFFIRCIKSNGNKIPNEFDDETVQRQLRYTGMLETVRIRQAGFNVRLTYDEFIQLYRILLPKGLLSSQNDVRDFLFTLNLNRDNYQLGGSKVFLRESEKYKLDCKLHQQIMASIVTLQRWFRACLERRRFLKIKSSVITLQSYCRMYLVQSLIKRTSAALKIQKLWRGYRARNWFEKIKFGLVLFQAHCRGFKVRKNLPDYKRYKQSSINARKTTQIMPARAGSFEETLLSKEPDSDESGANQEDSEIANCETTHNRLSLRSTLSLPSVTTNRPSSTTYFNYQQNNRLEDTKKEGVLLDSTLKRKISKAHKTIDYSDLDFLSQEQQQQRKGSDDSLGSQRSLESQQSSDSQSSITVRELKLPLDALLESSNSHRHKREQWSSTSTRSETDSESGIPQQELIIHSAPPVISDERQPQQQQQSIYRNFSSDEIYNSSASEKQQQDIGITSSSPLSPKAQLKRSVAALSIHNLSTAQAKRNSEGLKSFPPVRRPNRDILRFNSDEKQRDRQQQQQQQPQQQEQQDVYYAYDHTPNKLEQILGKPEAPARITRKSKRMHVKSLGEETTDSGSSGGFLVIDKNIMLGTIEESKPNTNLQVTGFNNSFAQKLPSLTPKRQRQHNIGGLDLRRRNSDPATKGVGLVVISDNPSGGSSSQIVAKTTIQSQDDFKWQNTNTFSMAGHSFRKIHRISKDDMCTFCNGKMDPFITHIYKCSYCKKMFHTKCIQNKSVLQMPCDHNNSNPDNNSSNSSSNTTSGSKSGRRKHRKYSRTPYDLRKPEDGKFSLTGTSEFTDRTDQIITGAEELTLMQQFITDKIMKIENDVGEKPSEVDRLFKQALREFKDNLVQLYSAASKHGFEACCIRYKDLITNFMQAMETVCQREQKENNKDFPVTMSVNAFRGFMNEFMSSRAEDKPNKTKRKKEKKRKVETIKFKGHTFLLTIINIPTACEICNSFFMWPIERGLVCQSCKSTCHKKCYTNTTSICVKESAGLLQGGGGIHRIFGVPLVTLLTDENKIPFVIERLLRTIELKGLYIEGIYRKSGVSSKIKELKAKMDEDPDEIDFEKYQVHVLASVLKSFLREMPEPLLTFECYENFITAADLNDPQDRVATLYDILKKLPSSNYDLMERLMFHLAQVALHEEVNRMSPPSLAIVFAPCVLRTNKLVPAQDSLQDIGSQTQCIETIIREQLLKLRSTLDDIDTLDTACRAATNRLSSLRGSKVFSPDELLPANNNNHLNSPQQRTVDGVDDDDDDEDEEEHLLVDHIQKIQHEKEHLTSTLPTLTHVTSDDDMLSTDGDGSLDDISYIDGEHHHKKVAHNKVAIVRSISGGSGCGGDAMMMMIPSSTAAAITVLPKLKRQLSSDVVSSSTGNSNNNKVVEDCEDPIMV